MLCGFEGVSGCGCGVSGRSSDCAAGQANVTSSGIYACMHACMHAARPPPRLAPQVLRRQQEKEAELERARAERDAEAARKALLTKLQLQDKVRGAGLGCGCAGENGAAMLGVTPPLPSAPPYGDAHRARAWRRAGGATLTSAASGWRPSPRRRSAHASCWSAARRCRGSAAWPTCRPRCSASRLCRCAAGAV